MHIKQGIQGLYKAEYEFGLYLLDRILRSVQI